MLVSDEYVRDEQGRTVGAVLILVLVDVGLGPCIPKRSG